MSFVNRPKATEGVTKLVELSSLVARSRFRILLQRIKTAGKLPERKLQIFVTRHTSFLLLIRAEGGDKKKNRNGPKVFPFDISGIDLCASILGRIYQLCVGW